MARGIIPFGYKMVDGTIGIVPKEALQLRRMCRAYLSGLSLSKAAAAVGLKKDHSRAGALMLNPRYCGNEFYPPILDKELQDAVRAEKERRAKRWGKDKLKKKSPKPAPISTQFHMKKKLATHQNPYRQAEYMYSLIESEETTWQM